MQHPKRIPKASREFLYTESNKDHKFGSIMIFLSKLIFAMIIKKNIYVYI